jgi:hypothetical protein
MAKTITKTARKTNRATLVKDASKLVGDACFIAGNASATLREAIAQAIEILGGWDANAKSGDLAYLEQKTVRDEGAKEFRVGNIMRTPSLNCATREAALLWLTQAEKDKSSENWAHVTDADRTFRVLWSRALAANGVERQGNKDQSDKRAPRGQTDQTVKASDKPAAAKPESKGASIAEAQEKANAKLANQMTAVLSIGSALEAATFLQGLLQHVENVAAHNDRAFTGEGEKHAAAVKLQKIMKTLHTLEKDAAQAVELLKPAE